MTQGTEQPLDARPELDGLPVLLVEDNARLRGLLVQTLESLGCSVTSAADAGESLRLLEGGHGFRLLVSDIRMPGPMDGIGLAERVSQQYPGIGILLITGFTHTVRIPFPVLSKPFGPDQLLAALQDIVRCAGANAS